MTRAHTTEITFDDGDFFTAKLDDGGVRIGLKNVRCFDIPAGHALFDRVTEAASRAEVESHFDELVGAYA